MCQWQTVSMEGFNEQQRACPSQIVSTEGFTPHECAHYAPIWPVEIRRGSSLRVTI